MKKIILFIFLLIFFLGSVDKSYGLQAAPPCTKDNEVGCSYNTGDPRSGYYTSKCCTAGFTCEGAIRDPSYPAGAPGTLYINGTCKSSETQPQGCKNDGNTGCTTGESRNIGCCTSTSMCTGYQRGVPDSGKCVPADDNSGTGTRGVVAWGDPESGSSLRDVSNLLGNNAPDNASKASFNTIIKLIVNLLIITAIVLSVIYLIWGGVDWIMSGGDKQKLQNARQKVIFAIIGLVVVFTSFMILNFIKSFLKII